MAFAELAVECERLARDFGRLALADVSGAIVTERELKWCRRPIPRIKDYDRLGARITAKPRDGVIFGWADGCELSDMAPQSAEESVSAPVWYGPINCEPSLNYVGQSVVMESGWSTLHEWELSGANASHAFDLLERTGQWTQKRWGWLSRLLWPGRESVAGKSCWPDVVSQVSELARDATLPRPEWSVIVGEYRAWWPVAIWKRRERFSLGGHHCTPEDIERIGEDPEVVLARRKHWLRDSETALEWLANKFRNHEQPVAPVVVPADPVVEDGLYDAERLFVWGGRRYETLTPRMIRVLRLLLDERKKGFPDVSLGTIEGVAKVCITGGMHNQVFKVKRKGWPRGMLHPVHVVVISVGSGVYRFIDPKKVPDKVPGCS